MLLHLLHWLAKWFFTIGTVWSFIAMCKQLAMPYAPRTEIAPSGRRIRKGTLDNVMDGIGAMWGFACFASIAAVLWLM